MIFGTKTDVVLGMHFGMVSDQFGRCFGFHFGTILGSFLILKAVLFWGFVLERFGAHFGSF